MTNKFRSSYSNQLIPYEHLCSCEQLFLRFCILIVNHEKIKTKLPNTNMILANFNDHNFFHFKNIIDQLSILNCFQIKIFC